MAEWDQTETQTIYTNLSQKYILAGTRRLRGGSSPVLELAASTLLTTTAVIKGAAYLTASAAAVAVTISSLAF